MTLQYVEFQLKRNDINKALIEKHSGSRQLCTVLP